MRGLPKAVKNSLEKARDSALLAVEVYNKPAVKFKSGGYISLMVIAWTSLFHAIFFRRKVRPFYRKPSGRFQKVEGDFKYWELDECLRQYYGTDIANPVRKNLADAVKHNPASKPVADFIQQYRSTISPEILASGRYSFKAFLIQVANHKSANALPIQFVHYDKMHDYYGYTQAWVDFLLEKLKEPNEWDALFVRNAPVEPGSGQPGSGG